MTELVAFVLDRAPQLRVIEHDHDIGYDIGTAAEYFGADLAAVRVGDAQGEDEGRAAYDWWPLTKGGLAVGELRDDASGLTIHVGSRRAPRPLCRK